jgi:hypothetical protein
VSNQRVYVTSHKVPGGYPYFRVEAKVSDAFIDGEVERRYGRTAAAGAHEWQAFDESEIEKAEPAEGAVAE